MLFLAGVYADYRNGTARFRWVKAPTSQELTQLVHTIAYRGPRLSRKKGHGKARVAVARKPAMLLHRLWLREETFDRQQA